MFYNSLLSYARNFLVFQLSSILYNKRPSLLLSTILYNQNRRFPTLYYFIQPTSAF